MPIPNNIDGKFVNFLQEIGIREEIAHALWNADIRTPQELASHDVKDIQKICDNPLLVNMIMPQLQKNVYAIMMAEDPFTEAISVFKHLSGDSKTHLIKQLVSSDGSPFWEDTSSSSTMLTQSTSGERYSSVAPLLQAGGMPTTSDTEQNVPSQTARQAPNVTHRPSNEAQARNQQNETMEVDAQQTLRNPPAQTRGRDTYQNTNMVIGARGTGAERIRQHQNQRSYESDTSAAGSGNRIQITGGNFVQANLFGKATYENVNSEILTTLGDADDLVARRKTKLNSSFILNGQEVPTSDLLWQDGDFWMNKLDVQTVAPQQYDQHFAQDDVYPFNNWGDSQALIINNINFGPRTPAREGADKDTKMMQELVSKMGFQSTVKENKTRNQILQIMKEFSQSTTLHKSSAAWIFIGSHGERTQTGKDVFLGSDDKRIYLDEIMDFFSNKNCPALRGKPKIFMLQFCRKDSANNSEQGPSNRLQRDANAAAGSGDAASGLLHEISDVIKVYATIAGQQAFRDTSDGTWFVTAIAKVFEEHSNHEDLVGMLTRVNRQVSIKQGRDGDKTVVQLSEFHSTLLKKMMFFPMQRD